MKNRVIIFDGNHLAYRAYYKFGNLQTIDGVRTGVIYGMPYIAESLIRRLSPKKVIMTLDGGSHFSRKEVLPDYKKRDQKLGFDREDFYRQKDVAKEIFMAMGIRVAWRKGWEADDLIAQIAWKYSKKGYEVIIISADKDFHQLISPNIMGDHAGPISMFNVNKGIILDYHNLKEHFPYEPEQCVDYLCLTGDKSDNIPGYPGMGVKRGTQFLHDFSSIKNFLKHDYKFGKMDKVKLKEIYKRNKKVVDLKFFYKKYGAQQSIPWLNPNNGFQQGRLTSLCKTYEINSFLKPQFINTFKNIHE